MNLNFLLIIFSVLITWCLSFQFKAPTVSATDRTINVYTQYQITLQRQFNSDLSSTPWNTESVPAGATIQITFPSEYEISGGQACDYVLINGSPSSYTCSANPSNNIITISNAIPTSLYISQVDLQIFNVLNPFPAITTSSFLGAIGNDHSLSDSFSAVSLTPATFESSYVTFNPTTVNITGNMIITLAITNKLPANSSITIQFPFNLQWSQDVSSNHPLPLTSSMSCTSLSPSINTGLICEGLTSSQIVTITNITNIELPANSTLNFSVNGLFSPPVQNPTDTIIVTTYATIPSGTYSIDTSTPTISGLVAKILNDLTISAVGGTKIINTNIAMTFLFTLKDTLTKDDYFQAIFPTGTSITPQAVQSTFSLASNYSYNSVTGVLRIYQSSFSPTRYTGFSSNVTFLTYKTPNTTKPTGPIIFQIMKAGSAKMRGSGYFTADPKTYTMIISTNDTKINANTQYQLNFNLIDAIDPTGYFILTIPPQLIINSPGINIVINSNSPSSINPNPTITSINSTTYNISNLNATSLALAIPIQNLTLIISSFTQPGSVISISSFSISIYFSTQNYLSATTQQTNTITLVAGSITNPSVSADSEFTYTPASLTLSFSIQNRIQSGGFFNIVLPSEIHLNPNFTLSCSLISNNFSISISSCTNLSSSSIYVEVGQSVPSLAQIKLTISKISTPNSTLPTSTFSLTTMDSSKNIIDTLGTSFSLSVSKLNSIYSYSQTRGGLTNSQLTNYGISLQLLQIVNSNQKNFIQLLFPTQTTLSLSNLNVTLYYRTTNSTSNLTYTLVTESPIHLIVYLPAPLPTFTNLSEYEIVIAGIINPPSLKPTSIGIQTKVGFSRTNGNVTQSYYYSQYTGAPIQNNKTSNFSSLNYKYSKGILFSNTNLTTNLILTTASSVSYLQLQFDSKLSVTGLIGQLLSICLTNISSISLTCAITQKTPKAIIKISSSSSFPVNSTISIIIGPILTPTIHQLSHSPSVLTSYDSQDYPISRNTNDIVFVAECSLPCWSCTSNSSQCTSCYQSFHNITNLIYYTASNSSYGTCKSSCDLEYFINETENPFLCQPCSSTCKQCINSSLTCISCNASAYLYNDSCQATCPNGTYSLIINGTGICQVCPIGCLLCSSGSVCSSCSAPYFIYNQQCSLNCPVNITIPNSIFNICQLCNSTCTACSGLVDNCTSCINQFVLKIVNGTGVCSNTCGNTSMYISNGTCQSCDPSCSTCSNISTNCTSCDINGTLKYFYLNSCFSECPAQYYSTSTLNYICKQCSSLTSLHCKNCSKDGQSCLSCDVGYVFFNDSLCLNSTPNGYVNISGEAVPCKNGCATCSVTALNCTSCDLPLLFYNNTCVSLCPNLTTSVNGSCLSCQSPCLQCSSAINKCLSCIDTYYFVSSSSSCVISTQCPTNTYPNISTQICAQCVPPCLSCSSFVACTTCVKGFYFYSMTALCLDECPAGWVGIVNVCVKCISPCNNCQTSASNCTNCIFLHYLNPFTNQCLLQCPANVTVANQVTMKCDLCNPLCLYCANLTSLCTACPAGTFLFLNQCLTDCLAGYFPQLSTRQCVQCSTTCKTCTSSSTKCTSCNNNEYLYSNTCVSQCPSNYAIIHTNTTNNVSMCTACSSVLTGCQICTSSRQCLTCSSNYILLNATCYSQCPSGYIYDEQNKKCQTIAENIDKILSNALSSSSVFPMPFTIIGFSLFIACIMSKLQNKNTYLIGAAYSLSGVLQTASLIYLVIRYYLYDNNMQKIGAEQISVSKINITSLPTLTIGLLIIYGINLLGLFAQTPILCSDSKFEGWLKNHFHRAFFVFVTFFSLIFNYKLKLIMFCKMFSFTCTRSQLESVQKFRVFNILSFLGVGHEVFVIYMSIVLIMQLKSSTNFITNPIFLTFIDTITISFLSIILSLVVSKKEDDFFTEIADNGYVLNKKVSIEGEDLCKQGMEPNYLKGEENKNKPKANHMDSLHQLLNKENEEEHYEDEEISLSFSDNRSQLEGKDKNKQNRKDSNEESDKESSNERMRNKKGPKQLYFANEQSSNPIKRDLISGKAQYSKKGSSKIYDQSFIKAGSNSVLLSKVENFEVDEVNIPANKTFLLGYANQSNQIKQENDSNKEVIEQSEIEKQKQNKSNVENNWINGSQNKLLVQQSNEESESSKKQSIEEKKQEEIQVNQTKSLQKPNQSKMYRFREEKQLNRSQDQEIQAKIANKMQQLEGLKRQNSVKQLQRARNRSQSRDRASMIDKISNKYSVSERINNQTDPLQSEKSKNIFQQHQRQLENVVIIQNNQDIENEMIKQNSTLIKQLEEQQRQKQLQEELQHENLNIKEEIQMINSMAVSKLEQDKQAKLMQSQPINTVPQNISKLDGQSGNEVVRATKVQDKIEEELTTLQKESKKSKPEDVKKQQQKNKAQNKTIKQTEELSNNEGADNLKPSSKKQNVQNMFDSFLEQASDQRELKMQPEENKQLFEQIDNANIGNENKKTISKKSKNIFEYENQDGQLQESGLDESQPDMDEEINHRPLRSRQGSVRLKKEDSSNRRNNELDSLQDDSIRSHQLPRNEDHGQIGRQESVQTKLFVRDGPNDEKTTRKIFEKPPLQKFSLNNSEQSRIYTAGRRQFEDSMSNKKSLIEFSHNDKKSKKFFDEGDGETITKIQDKRNKSLYGVPMKPKKQTNNSSEFTDQIIMKPGYFHELNDSGDTPLNKPRYTSTMNVDESGHIPKKPSVNLTARPVYTRLSSSQGRKKSIDQNATAGQNMFTKKSSIQQSNAAKQEQQDDLNAYYGRKNRKSKQRSRSKSRQRVPSEKQLERIKQMQKVYLQKLTMPKKQK